MLLAVEARGHIWEFTTSKACQEVSRPATMGLQRPKYIFDDRMLMRSGKGMVLGGKYSIRGFCCITLLLGRLWRVDCEFKFSGKHYILEQLRYHYRYKAKFECWILLAVGSASSKGRVHGNKRGKVD